jgi:hypothetical protein
MAQLARAELFSPDEMVCVHVMNRAVRRCFLMGSDPLTGKNFDHRKLWMERKLQQQAAHFGIDLLGSSIMDNHFHLVLRSRPDVVKTWDDTQVAYRWCMLCPNRKYPDGSPKEPNEAELNAIRCDPQQLQEIRRRLSDISWWMRLLCQHVGQRANREMNESGKFWESRFKAVRLLDDTALLACVSYVDLNPIRAALAEAIEASDYTSAKKRLEALLQQQSASRPAAQELADGSLAPVHLDERHAPLGAQPSASGRRCSDKGFLNMTAQEYLTLLDWTARQLVPGKAGVTPAELPPILERVGLKPGSWLKLVGKFGKLFHNVAGKPHTIADNRSRLSKRRYRVRSQLEAVFSD